MNIEIMVDSSKRSPDGFLKVSLKMPDGGPSYKLDINFGGLGYYYRSPKPLALDFIFIASICYGIDKMVARASAPDCWTRDLNVTIPVSDTTVWEDVATDLEDALGFLTGDVWNLSFSLIEKPLVRSLYGSSPRFGKFLRADAVCLFSGGLDSLAGAIDLLASTSDQRVLLVSHYDAAAGEQEQLFEPIRKEYAKRVQQIRTRVRLDPVSAPEGTLRSRSLVFLSLGLYLAQAFGPDVPLYAYENGHIALNVPLTPSRAGSCSTRTMHPFFLNQVVSTLSQVGINNPLYRPFEMKTKGQCLSECANMNLLRSIYAHSVSCSHPSRRQYWVRRNANNCGYCMPCLIRRAALHCLGVDQGAAYGVDVCAGELSVQNPGESADDLRAMVDFLRQHKTTNTLREEILRIASVDNESARAQMLTRGFEEVRTLIRDKGDVALRTAAGM